jgi:DNA-binding MarR family transcriptional regulator
VNPPEHCQGDETDQLIAQLERVQESFERRAMFALAEPLTATSLTMQQFKVLTMIAVDPAHATGANLATLLRVSLASMSAMVDRLVDQGMVRRSEDPNDRRVRRLSITAAGSEIIRTLLSMSRPMPTPILRRLPLEDLRALAQGVAAVDRVAQAMTNGGRVPEDTRS